LAAAVRKVDGELVTVPPAAWRRHFARPDDPKRIVGYNDYWKRDITAPALPSRMPFAEALEGREILIGGTERGKPAAWVESMIAQSDLAIWLGESEIPAYPPERPADWPRRHGDTLRATTDEQIYWFLAGYAVRALEGGKAATRDEARDAVMRENVAPARDAERLHAELPARLKNPNRSKGLTTRS